MQDYLYKGVSIKHCLSPVPRGLMLLCNAEVFLEKPENVKRWTSMWIMSPVTSFSEYREVDCCESYHINAKKPLQQLFISILPPDTYTLKNECKGELILFQVFKSW